MFFLQALKKPFSRLRESELLRLRHLPQELAREGEERQATAQAACEQGWLLDSLVEGEAPGDRAELLGLGSSAGGGGDGDGAALRAAKAAAAEACAAAAEEGDDAAACVPLLVGNPDSDSLDADSVPCVPAATARQLSTPAAVRFFMQEYRSSRQAQREQAERGALRTATANRMAAEATAAAAALRRLESEVLGSGAGDDAQGGSLDYGGCAIDWESDGRGSSFSSFTASAGGGGSSTAATTAVATTNGSSYGVDAWGRSDAMAAITGYAEEPAQLEPAAPLPPPRPRPSELSGHFIVCGAEESFCSFVDHLRKCGPADTPIVVLHPSRPDVVCEDGDRLVGGGGGGQDGRPAPRGPIYHVEGSASDAASLRQAGASTARALIYLAKAGGAGGRALRASSVATRPAGHALALPSTGAAPPMLLYASRADFACERAGTRPATLQPIFCQRRTAHETKAISPCLAPGGAARPVRSAQSIGGSVEQERSTREAVLADAQALLAVYGEAPGAARFGHARWTARGGSGRAARRGGLIVARRSPVHAFQSATASGGDVWV